MFRNLYPYEIEVRVQQCKKNGCSLLLYKDARCDMAILDETVGVMGWKREHSRDNKNCTISLWDKERNQWVGKEDTGTESNTEQAKGLASDSFKRAGFNCGIGRELYSSPFIWIKLNQEEVKLDDRKKDKFGNPLASLNKGVSFRVSKIVSSASKHIEYVEIVDNMNKIRFTHGKEPSLKWYINEELKKLSKEIQLDYVTKIKSGDLEADEKLLDTLRGVI
jgi:hypothetical protein